MRHHGTILASVTASLFVISHARADEPVPAVSFTPPTGDQMLSMGNDMVQGFRFRVKEPIVVTDIGWFVDPRYLQLNADHPVGIYGSDGVLRGSGVVPRGAPGVLVGNFRYVALAAPIALHPGTYTVIGYHPSNQDVTCHVAPGFAAHDALVFEAPVERYNVGGLTFASNTAQTILGGNYRFGPSFRFRTHRPDAATTIGDDVTGILYQAGSALAPDGTLVVAGYGEGPDDQTALREAVVARFDKSGAKVVQTWVEGGDGGSFYAQAVAVDSTGAAIVGGTWQGGNSADLLLVKLAPDGAELWRARYAGALSWGLDTVGGIAFDADDNVFIAGWTEVQGQSYNLLLRKYSASGALVWSTTWDGPAHASDQGRMVHVGPGGLVWVGGETTIHDGTNYRQRLLLARFQDHGATVTHESAEALDAQPVWPYSKSAIDASGNAYIVGYRRDASGADFGWVARRAPDGTGWDRTIPTTRWSYLYAVAADARGNVFVAGSNHDFQSDNAVTLRLDAETGAVDWHATFHTFAADYAFDVAPDGRGGAFIAGQSGFHGSSEEYDALAVHYDKDGGEVWASTWDGPARKTDDANAVHFAGDVVYVVATTGWTLDNADRDLVVLTWDEPAVVDEDGDGVPDDDDVCADFDDHVDGDNDGTPDGCDVCPEDAANDADGDGICESSDNCPTVPNDNQSNADGDAYGDACEPDDDGDGVVDDHDNCPLDDNADQADVDHDGAGDACDDDDDGDGVTDRDDVCLGSPVGATVLDNGCTVTQQCPCDGGWKNHGAYVTCVGRAADQLRDRGRITATQRNGYVTAAASLRCGK